MVAPNITAEQVQTLIRNATNIQVLDRGGQKVVFTGMINGQKYALKFLCPEPQQWPDQGGDVIDAVTARAQREVETMQQYSTPYLVRMGPIGLSTGNVDGTKVIFFSEEFIEGRNLRQYLHESGTLPLNELIQLALHISEAVSAIWQFSKIHRDIKPSNIMRRSSNGDYVLLDMGLVFDLQDSSLSVTPVGTPLYFSPEQVDFDNRRNAMNFRSDLFSLGIVLYEMSTGRHPFCPPATATTWEVIGNIRNSIPVPPKSLRFDIPDSLNDIILRLLAKRPALRYRSIQLFQQALNEVFAEGGI